MAKQVKQDTYYRFGWIFLAFVAVVAFFVLSRELTAVLAALQSGALETRQILALAMAGSALFAMLAKNKRGFSLFLFMVAFGIGYYLLLTYSITYPNLSSAIANGTAVAYLNGYVSLPASTVAMLYVFVVPGLLWLFSMIGLSGHGAAKFTRFLITLMTLTMIALSVLLILKDPTITAARSILALTVIPWFFSLARGTYGENYEPTKTTAVATRDGKRFDDSRDDRRRDDDRRYDDRRDDRRYDDRRYDDRRYDDRRYDDRRDDRRYDDRRDDRRYDDRRDDRRYDDRDDRRLPAPIRSADKKSVATSGSEFTGSAFGLLGVNILTFLLSALTLGFALPAMVCYKQRWMTRHTIIDDRHLTFDGTAMQLFGKWIGWLILTVLTVGIYSFFIPMRMQKWVISHTHLK